MDETHTDDTWFADGSGRFPFMGGWPARFRAGRGDISLIILHVLREKPMHGYEVIRTLEERSHGLWRPSAGSVYPTLQLLEEQELVKARETDGKKVYSLTEKGETAAKEPPATHPWERGNQAAGHLFHEVGGVIREAAKAMKAIARTGTDAQVAEAKSILSEAAKKLTALAETLDDRVG